VLRTLRSRDTGQMISVANISSSCGLRDVNRFPIVAFGERPSSLAPCVLGSVRRDRPPFRRGPMNS
jgi:hypothetical protein